jgi:hypothetical protein
MSMPFARSTALLALAPWALYGCNGTEGDSAATACEAPTASAGADVSANLGEAVTLDGSASTVCETASGVTFTWSFESIPTDSEVTDGALSDNKTASAISPKFVPDAEGDYVLSLTVADSENSSGADLVVVTVTDTSDRPPVAVCGEDVSTEEGTRVELDGSESYDPEGAELTYSWAITTSPECSELTSASIFNSGGPTPTVVPDCAGLFMVSLVVSDGIQWSDADYCEIEVTSGNSTPVADAGDSSDLAACTENPLQLDGYGSYDNDGDELSYQWSLVSVPGSSASTDADFSDPNSPAPTFAWDVAGAYSFKLEVSDGNQWSSPDLVTYTILDGSENTTPVSNAGDDVSVSSTAACTSASYTWTCEDCPAAETEVDGSDSYDSDGDPLTFYWSEATSSLSFANPFSQITEVIVPAGPAEYGVETETTYEVNLAAADCLESDNDTLILTYTCTGESSP